MVKPTLFIGSSAEHVKLAFSIQSSLQHDVHPFVWTQGTFQPSHFALESLEDALDVADFAVLVCAPDDLTTIRREQHATVRDNVIFELGMFIGRLSRKRTFLISPRGVELHLPSDLNGLTPETFDPEQMANPEAALGPACSKIRTAMQKLGPLPRVNTNDGLEAESEPEKTPTTDTSNLAEPAPDWTVDNFEWNYFFALIQQDNERADRIDHAFLSSSHATPPEALAVWQSWKEIAAMWAGQHANVELLRNQITSFPDEPRLQEFLGQALAHYGDKESAVEAFAAAAKSAPDVQTVSRVVKKALALKSQTTESSHVVALRQRLLEMKVETHSEKSAFVGAMEAIAIAAKLEDIAITIAEVAVSLAPEDTAARFELARRYADSNQNDLSMLHYEAIPLLERSGVAWNNLGVSYSRLQMSGKATAAYEAAVGKDETIAQGNLAHKLIGAGFFDEAQKRAEAAIAIKDHHDSLVGVFASIKQARESEEETHNAARATSKSHQSARMELGKAALLFGGPDIVGIWETEDGQLAITDNGDGSYTGVGEVSREVSNRGLGLGALFAQNRAENHRILVTLRRLGNTLEGTAVREGSQKPLTLLGTIDFNKKLLMKVSDDGLIISGFEITYNSKRVSWHRQTNVLADNGRQITQG